MISKTDFERFIKEKDEEALLPYKVENAVILAAGLSSRFKPLSERLPKGLCRVKGEVLIERQIKQLQEVGIKDIYVVVGYKKELFSYLEKDFSVKLIENPLYAVENNCSSLRAVVEYLGNTYICSVDNYFDENVFEPYVYEAYYSTIFIEGKTEEWCVEVDANNRIITVTIGGADSDIMLGHVYFDRKFSKRFVALLDKYREDSAVNSQVWEYLYLKHLGELSMVRRRYDSSRIHEFDSIKDALHYDCHFLEENDVTL